MARLDTGWHAHPKVLALGLPGMALHAWSISYCDSTRSDGFIPHGAWPALPGIGAACKALITAGLWERCDGGFRLHDYLDYNKSRAQIAEISAAMRANGHAGGEASAVAKRQAKAEAHGQQNSSKLPANGQADAQAKSSPGPGPGFNSRSVGRPVGPGRGVGEPTPRKSADFLPLSAMLGGEPPEVLERLSRPPIADQPTNRPTDLNSFETKDAAC